MVVNGGDNRRLQAGEIVGGRDGGRRRFGATGGSGKKRLTAADMPRMAKISRNRNTSTNPMPREHQGTFA